MMTRLDSAVAFWWRAQVVAVCAGAAAMTDDGKTTTGRATYSYVATYVEAEQTQARRGKRRT